MSNISKKFVATFCLIACFISTFINTDVYAYMQGIDVSSWQTGIDTYSINADFVICKATEGTTYVNPDCDRAYQGAKSSGKKVGVYHYASGGDPVAEAKFFVDNVSGYVGDAILVLDYEGYASTTGTWWAETWLDTVYNLTGVRPIIYMSNSVVNRYDWSRVRDKNYGLWNAGYYDGYVTKYGYVTDPPIIGNLGVWSDCVAMYQYTSSGRLPGWGGNLDFNIFYGDGSTWDAYAGHTPSSDYTPGTVPPSTGVSTYTVKAGDCLYNIGIKFGVSWDVIASANGIYSPYVIYPGQVINIPGDVNANSYVVQAGDCLSVIACDLGLSVSYLASVNDIQNVSLIYPGQVIYY